MPRVNAGKVQINCEDHGSGDNVVLAVHGNLGCADWLHLALPLLPREIRVIVAEWRGCGASDKPEPASDYANYSMSTHAGDMLGLLDALGIAQCHLCFRPTWTSSIPSWSRSGASSRKAGA
jgi:pimeloyl-ACP methyl ester carboxylesterase